MPVAKLRGPNTIHCGGVCRPVSLLPSCYYLTVAPRLRNRPINRGWVLTNGPTRSDIDASTLDGKVLCGYQGWFNTPCDTEKFGFSHWGQGLEKGDGRFIVDMWPDESEYAPDDLCEVPGLKMPDGSPARLYSGSSSKG